MDGKSTSCSRIKHSGGKCPSQDNLTPECEMEMISMPNEKKNPVSELIIFQLMHIWVSPELLNFCAGSLDNIYISYTDNSLFPLFF